MKYLFLLIVAVLFVSTPVFAYDLSVTSVENPYDLVMIEGEIDDGKSFVGELLSFPVLFEFSVSDPQEVPVRVRQQYRGAEEPNNLSLIIIRENDDGRGVSEVSRLSPEQSDWIRVKDSALGMSFWEVETVASLSREGIYRVEVSTPGNQGKYFLSLGDYENNGYFKTIGHAYKIQNFHDYSVFRILVSSYVYYLLGVVLLSLLISKTWKYRRLISHVD